MNRRQFLKASAVGALVTSGPTVPGSFGVAVFAQTAAAGANPKLLDSMYAVEQIINKGGARRNASVVRISSWSTHLP